MATNENEIYEAIVVGAGVMGSATAYYLSKQFGHKILVIEQFDLLHRRGSSHGDSRIIRMTYPQDYYTALMKEAYLLWDQIETEAGTQVMRKTGGLDFGRSDNPGLCKVIAVAQKMDVPHQILSPAQVSEKFPLIKLPENYTGLYSTETGVLNATKAVSVFQSLARLNGCQIVDNTKITRINVPENEEGNFEIETSTEKKFVGKICVITGGAWTQKIMSLIHKMDSTPELKIPLNPIQVTIGYWPVENPQDYCGRTSNFPVFINYEDGIIYGSPAIEFPGMIKCGHDYGNSCDPDKRDFLPGNEEIEKYVVPFLKNVFTAIKTDTPPRTESCMFTLSPDGNFIIDELPAIKNIFVGCGFSGHGFKLAPIVGKILAGFVNGEHVFEETIGDNFKLKRFLN